MAGIGDESTNRIAYAVSTCDERRKDKFLEYPEIEEWIKNINYVFVRENSGKKILLEQYGVDSKVVLDPTLLMSGSNWARLLGLKKKTDNYVLCYAFNLTENQKSMINESANRLGCSVKYGNILNGKEKEQESWSPCEFLEAIMNAKEVFTDSFHGTVFSILFHKEFIVFDNGNDIESDPYYNIDRMNTLLSLLELNDRLVTEDKSKNLDEINYVRIDAILEVHRKECLSLLRGSIA